MLSRHLDFEARAAALMADRRGPSTPPEDPALHVTGLAIARTTFGLHTEQDGQHPQQPDPRIERVLACRSCSKTIFHSAPHR